MAIIMGAAFGGTIYMGAVVAAPVPVIGGADVDPFSFVPATNVALSSVNTSNVETITGVGSPWAISIDVGTYSINGAPFTAVAGVISAADEVEVRVTASGSYSTAVVSTLTIDTVTGQYSVSTIIDPNAVPAGRSELSIAIGMSL